MEGFVLAFLEANARGIPCIGPNTGGCPEAISEGKSGFICDPKDPNSIAEKMKNIFEGAIDSKNCREWAEEHDIVLSARTIADLYSAA